METLDEVRFRRQFQSWCCCLLINFSLCSILTLGSISAASQPESVPVPLAYENDVHFVDCDIYDESMQIISSADMKPRSDVLRNRQYLMRVLEQSSDDVMEEVGVRVLPEHLLGTIIRETGGVNLSEVLDQTDWLEDLVMGNRACEKSTCYYNRLGISHFVGGSVVNGKDTGDPYSMPVDTSWRSYRQAKRAAESHGANGDHALGFIQFEIPYIDDRMIHLFPVEKLGLLEPDFVRPNFFYLPDQIYAMAFYLGECGMRDSLYLEVLKDPDYQALEERNKAFIRFVMQTTVYRCGSVLQSSKTIFRELVQAKKNGEIEYFDQMLKPFQDSFYDPETKVMTNYDPTGCRKYIRDTYGITAGDLDSISWDGVYSACAGRMAWEGMQEDVETDIRQARIETFHLNSFQQLQMEEEPL